MSANALLFPGQGAQKVGMGRDVFERYEAARTVFAHASEAIQTDMEEACFQGPQEALGRTDLCQPAILTVSVAILRAIQQELGCPLEATWVAGLSLGEYTALVAANALEFADAVRLVYARGRYMQEACDANRGTMYSVIGLDDQQVEEACHRVQRDGGRVWPANYNSPGQLVISGVEDAAARAAAICTDMGARRVVQLKVAGAFHTPLMEPAAVHLASELKHARMREPSCPVVCNVTGQPVRDAEQIRSLLVAQVTSPVRWTQSMRGCIERGAKRFFEVGPGRVLQGLLKRTDPAATCVSVGTAEEVQEVAAAL